MLNVWNAGYNCPSISQELSDPAQHRPRVDEMLQHIGKDDTVEIILVFQLDLLGIPYKQAVNNISGVRSCRLARFDGHDLQLAAGACGS